MASKYTTKKIGTFLTWILMLLIVVGFIGVFAKYTGGFTTDFKTFYVTVNGEEVFTSASGYEMAVDKPLVVNVKYTLTNESQGYSVKVVPNVIEGKNFGFFVDGIQYSYQAQKDLTKGFVIDYKESSFSIAPKGTVTDILQAVYPNGVVEDCSQYIYENMYTLVVTSSDGESSVRINFSCIYPVGGIELDKDVILF